MRNAAHYQFMDVFGNLFVVYKDVALLVPTELTEFNRLLAIERTAYNFDRKSPLTIRINELDEQTGNDLHGLTDAVKSALHSHDPQVAESARMLYERIQQLGIIYSMPLEEQTATVTKLTDEFTGRLAVDVTKVGVNSWVTYILNDNLAITGLMQQRSAEVSNRPQGRLRNGIRHEIEAVYKRITGILDANIVTGGEALCGALVRQLNVEIAYFNEHDTPHRTRKNIADTVAVPVPVQTYTGEPVIVIPELHCVEEGQETKKLVFATDFTVTYKDNINLGDAEITVRGKGTYKGTKIITFNIARML
jgi:hypothetical protein